MNNENASWLVSNSVCKKGTAGLYPALLLSYKSHCHWVWVCTCLCEFADAVFPAHETKSSEKLSRTQCTQEIRQKLREFITWHSLCFSYIFLSIFTQFPALANSLQPVHTEREKTVQRHLLTCLLTDPVVWKQYNDEDFTHSRHKVSNPILSLI